MEQFALYDLREEEKIAGVFSWRQLGYIAVGILLVVAPLVQLLGHVVKGTNAGIWWLALPWLLLVGVVVLLLGWAPAGVGPLPGPPFDQNYTPQDPPLRLDQWLIHWWRWRQQKRYLPWIHVPLLDEEED